MNTRPRNIKINDRDFLVEEEGAGEPLILLAGGPAASHLIFKPYFSAFAEKYRVIYYDYFGRGRSGRPSSYQEISFSSDVEDLEALRQALGLEKINLYGFSYGGMIAQAYYRQRGKRPTRFPAPVKRAGHARADIGRPL